MRRLQVLQSTEALALIKPLLSQPGGQALELGDSDFILIADQQARLAEILDLLDRLDQRQPGDRARVERIAVQHLGATELVAQVNVAVAARDAIEPRALSGKLTAASDGRSVILVAPESARNEWLSLISQFDQREPVDTRVYSPKHFSLEDVGTLIGQTTRDSTVSGGDRWKLVTDNLTGSLIVTATARQHEQIEALMERLARAPAGARRPVRAFIIRNRKVTELLEVLRDLIEEDAIGEEIIAAPVEADTEPASNEAESGDACLLYTSPSPRDRTRSRMPSSA